jgi:hypothetical protein
MLKFLVSTRCGCRILSGYACYTLSLSMKWRIPGIRNTRLDFSVRARKIGDRRWAWEPPQTDGMVAFDRYPFIWDIVRAAPSDSDAIIDTLGESKPIPQNEKWEIEFRFSKWGTTIFRKRLYVCTNAYNPKAFGIPTFTIFEA